MANCRNFTITLQNSGNAEMKAKRFEYKDGSTWKTENMFGLDGFTKIAEGRCADFKRNLHGVRDESTQFRVTFQIRMSDGWSSDHTETTDAFTCREDGSKTVYLTLMVSE